MQKSLFLYKQDNRKAQKNNKFLYPLSKNRYLLSIDTILLFLNIFKKKRIAYFFLLLNIEF